MTSNGKESVTTAGASPTARLGFEDGQVVQEFGWDDDVDNGLREEIESAVGSQLEEDNYDGVVDSVVLWWREGDGDLFDECVDALTGLAEGGSIVVLSPVAGHPEHVDPSDIEEAAQSAGLRASTTMRAGSDWMATKLVQGGVRQR
ncbi:DUF3052 domain-containing protein [Demetria terragena]|uniref:DUF3052 domain-containing protein n=1 Tax=Demetria terragena TaxID=63959 RepID=UPI00035F3CB3|nr:DUF3052 domain-containing protein [Demetria terragena]